MGSHSKDPPAIRVLPPTAVEGSVTLTDIMKDNTSASGGKDIVPAIETAQDSELVFINEGLPPIPSKTRLKIEKGDYVDFRELLPQKPSVDDSALTEWEENGIVVLTSSKQVRPKKKPIQDISSWFEAFMVFAAIRIRKHPDSASDLMAYGALIARSARDYRGSGWITYDFQFRRLAAARGKPANWGIKDVSLWNETVCKADLPSGSLGTPGSSEEKRGTKRQGQLGTQSIATKKKPRDKERSWKESVCYPFSYSGKCPREKCEFLHICYNCGEGHSHTSCPKKKN